MNLTEVAILLPLLLPLLTAIVCLFFKNNRQAQHFVSVSGSVLLLASAVWLLSLVREHDILVTQIAGWRAPFGISLVVDMFSVIMLIVSAFVALLANIYSIKSITGRRKQLGYFVFFHFLMMGINGAFLAGDIFNLYVWFEVLLMASFVLLSLGNEKEQLIGAVKYMLLSFVASTFLLTGIGMIYAISGTLNMADLAVFVQENKDNSLITVAAMMIMLPFAVKAALFPVYFWLPASYPSPPIAVVAFFSGLLTKVGVYALIRFFTLIFIQDVNYTHTILLYAAAFTMFSGVLGAISMNGMRRILSLHIVSQIGYMIMGLALFTPLALAGALFYIVQHIIVKTNLFMITGVVEKIKGTSELKQIGGLYKKFPWLSLLFIISALSLAGLPPLSGFWAKLVLIKAGFEEHAYFVVVIALVTSLLTLFSMTKIWINVFWGEEKNEVGDDLISSEKQLFSENWKMLLPVVVLAVGALFIGLYSLPLMSLASQAAEQLMDPSVYIQGVLGD